MRMVIGLEAAQPIMFLLSSFFSISGGGGGPLTWLEKETGINERKSRVDWVKWEMDVEVIHGGQVHRL